MSTPENNTNSSTNKDNNNNNKINSAKEDDEEDLDALLAQADSMISEASNVVIDGFAIDSDEENENENADDEYDEYDGVVDVSIDSPSPPSLPPGTMSSTRSTGSASNTASSTTTTTTDHYGTNAPSKPPVDPLLHPLHEDVLASNNNNNSATATATGGGHFVTQPHNVANAAAAAMTSAMRSLGVQTHNQQQQPPPVMSSGGIQPNVTTTTTRTDATAAATADWEAQLKAQTSRFAAQFSTMAQRVATVASNVSSPQSMDGIGINNNNKNNNNYNFDSLVPMSVPVPVTAAVATNNHNVMGQPTTTTATATATPTTSGGSSPYGGNSSHGMMMMNPAQQQQQQQQQQQSLFHIELDAEQKTALVKMHCHNQTLYPGERVIMFLHNLLHVSDSTGFQYANNNNNNNNNNMNGNSSATVWCCAMTYYRLILFGTTQDMIRYIMNTVNHHTTTTITNNDTTAAAAAAAADTSGNTNSDENAAVTPTTTPPTPPSMLEHSFQTPKDWNHSCWPPAYPTVLEIPLATMEKVEKTVYTASTSTTTASTSTLSPSSSTPPTTATTTLMGLQIWSKTQRYWRLTTPNYADTIKAHQAILTYAFPGRRNLGYLFAFESRRADVVRAVVTEPTTGQKTVDLPLFRKRFEPVEEFQRQLLLKTNSSNRSNSSNHNKKTPSVQPWKIFTQLNAQYQLCSSYPSVLVGPASLDENNPDAVRLLQNCAAFRSEQRLPALSWASGIDGASIWRCSQPKIGLQGNRSSADELVLKHIMEAAKSANALRDQPPPVASNMMDASTMAAFTGSNDLASSHWIREANCGLKILDLRPRSAAMANRTGGYGYENTSNYPGTTLQFCDIGNIHAVRNAYQKMSALCLNTNSSSSTGIGVSSSSSSYDVNWGAAIEDTKWLSQIRTILAASWETAFWVHVHRMPVLLHCSHGWDRTSQVSALAQLMLDPYYRTMEGFACLMEKDFMSFGHPFHKRCAHGEGKGGVGVGVGDDGIPRRDGVGSGLVSGADGGAIDEGQISPIFLQFLDCVWQIVNQYPECFEITTDYILELSHHIYSCRFGNMLCDTERERELVAGIRQRTYSVWDHLEQDPDDPKSDPNAKLWRNKNYDPSPEVGGGILLMPMPTLLRNVTLWQERYAQFGPKATMRWRNSGQSRLRQLGPLTANGTQKQ